MTNIPPGKDVADRSSVALEGSEVQGSNLIQLTRRKARYQLDVALMEAAQLLLRGGTLESHQAALDLLKDEKLDASFAWERIHADETYPFSNDSDDAVHHAFVELIAHRLGQVALDGKTVLEVGVGFGNDLRALLARFDKLCAIGVDNSPTAIAGAKRGMEESGVDNRVSLIRGDYVPLLDDLEGANLRLVSGISSLHYYPSLVLEHVIFPMIARVLHPEEGELCLAMKTGNSPSANSPEQNRLLGWNDLYTSSIHKRDMVFRIYPETEEAILALLERSFNVRALRRMKLDYDQPGKPEEFWWVEATPKAR